MAKLIAAKEALKLAKKNGFNKMMKEIYERIYHAALKGKYGTSYQPQHLNITEAIYFTALTELSKKGYKVVWSPNVNRLIIIWGEE